MPGVPGTFNELAILIHPLLANFQAPGEIQLTLPCAHVPMRTHTDAHTQWESSSSQAKQEKEK